MTRPASAEEVERIRAIALADGTLPTPAQRWAAYKALVTWGYAVDPLGERAGAMYSHSHLCGELVRCFGARRSGFPKALRHHFNDDFGFSLLPDAYIFDFDRETVDCFEVEINSCVTRSKLEAYHGLAAYVDCEGWELALWTVNQYGLVAEIDPNISGAWLENFAKKVPR